MLNVSMEESGSSEGVEQSLAYDLQALQCAGQVVQHRRVAGMRLYQAQDTGSWIERDGCAVHHLWLVMVGQQCP